MGNDGIAYDFKNIIVLRIKFKISLIIRNIDQINSIFISIKKITNKPYSSYYGVTKNRFQ